MYIGKKIVNIFKSYLSQEEKMTNLAVVNTKGGVGKTTIGSMILPLIFAEDAKNGKSIRVYEIDDNNKSIFAENSVIDFQTIKVKEAEDILDMVQMDIDMAENVINIIDCGGGNDTVAVLNYIKEIKLQGLAYVIPTNDDIEQLNNIKQTINLIRSIDKNAKIVLILNRVAVSENQKITDDILKRQFIGLYGDDSLGIDRGLDEFEKELAGVAAIPNTPIFGILKNLKKTTTADRYLEEQETVVNIAKVRKGWASGSKEEYLKRMKEYRISKKVVDLYDNLEDFRNLLKGLTDETK